MHFKYKAVLTYSPPTQRGFIVGVDAMKLLSKPINFPFELDPNKVSDFLSKSDKQAINNVIDRATKHEEKYKTRATEINP